MDIYYLIIISFFPLFIHGIESKAYVSMKLINVNDCLYNIYFKNNTLFKYTYHSCNKNVNYSNPIVDKKLYEFGNNITFVIHDIAGTSFIKMDIYINEYIINCYHQKFWKCLDCRTNNSNYLYNESQQYFECYKPYSITSESQKYKNYTFIFLINSFDELNFEGNNVSSDFYALYPHKEIINISTSDIDNEIDLINFYNPDYFNIKNNTQNLSIKYENYYFKIYFENNSLNGKYIALDLNNSDIELNNGSSFKVNLSKVLRYKLSKEEKRNKYANLYFQIEGYNSPANTLLSKLIAEKIEYNFTISIFTNNSVCLNDIYPYFYKINETYFICFNLEKQEIIKNISKIMQDIEIGHNYEIKGKDITINIYPLNTELLSTLINITFEQCEKKIRNNNNLNNSSIITFLEFKINNSNSLNKQILFQVYNNKSLLNLNCTCNEFDINISKSYEFPDLFQISPIIKDKETETNIITTYYDSIFNRNMTKEELVNNLEKIMEEVIIGEYYEIKGNDYNMKISPTNTTYLSLLHMLIFKNVKIFLEVIIIFLNQDI